MNLSRLISLIGENNVKKIKNLNILVIGLGGVGGYTVESLIRSGLEKITLVDGDTIKKSNLNRQIIATNRNVNKYKTREFKKRIKKINNEASVTLINTFIDENNSYLLFTEEYDYIIDACDSVKVKQLLIKECIKRGIKLVSCMGMANKLDATKIEITTLDKTNYDPLAKRVRKDIDEDDAKKITVISSTEPAKKQLELGSTSYLPAIAGLLITNHIINDILGGE